MNAVFERDYVRISTSARFLWMRTGLALAVAAIAGVRLLGYYASPAAGSANVGSFVMTIAISVGATLMLLTAPGTFATVLVHARAQNTLAVLLSTPLTPFQLASGAFTARAASLAVFILATLPPLALGLAFGGVQLEQICAATAAVLAAALLVAAPSFVISAFARRTGAAVVSAYLASATVLTALSGLGAQLVSRGALATDVAWFSPLHAVGQALSAQAPPRTVLFQSILLLVLAVSAACVSIAVATWRLRTDAARGFDSVTRISAGRLPRAMTHENPVLDREMALSVEGSRGSARTLLAVLVVAELAYIAASMTSGDPTSLPLFGAFMIFEVGLLILAGAAAGATCFASERESGALDLIRATPLTPAEIIRGKLAGVLRSQLPCMAVPMVHLAWASFVRPPAGPNFVDAGIVSLAAIPATLVPLVIVTFTWTIFGMSQSLDQRDPHRAVARTMSALGIFAVLVAGMLGAIISGVSSAAGAGDAYLRNTVSYGANPVAAVLTGVALCRTGGSTSEMTRVPPAETAYALSSVVGLVIWLGLHLIAAFIIYHGLVKLYRTRFEG